MPLAIDTLVLIVLAIIVLAVMIYIIITVTQTPVMNCNSCKAEFTQYCRECYSSHCSSIKINDYKEGLCKCLNECGVPCDENQNPNCQQLQTQCLSVGIAYGC